MSNSEVVIVSAVRTPIGSFNGLLSSLKPVELGAIVIKETLNRVNVKPEEISEVILGQALTAGQGQNPSRQAAIKAGIPETVPAYTVNMLCGSGLKSIFLGYQAITCGDSKVVMCGGQESMSQSTHVIHLRSGVKMGDVSLLDTLLRDGLVDTMNNIHMGVTAENIRKKFNITREDQDKFAALSQKKVEESQKAGYFDKEIVPIEINIGKKTILLSQDEFPKAGTTVETLSKLKPVFDKEGTVTAGNSSGINDGAATVLLMDKKYAENKGIKSLGIIRGIAQVGVDSLIMGTGPIPAVKKLLTKVGWTIEEVDLFEVNEAFAVQSLSVIRELNLNPEKVNISGGAISLGHPIGASGCRVVVTLLYALERTNKHKGIATLCVGGGMGVAIAIERL